MQKEAAAVVTISAYCMNKALAHSLAQLKTRLLSLLACRIRHCFWTHPASFSSCGCTS